MAQYVAFHPRVEVLGLSINTFIARAGQYAALIKKIIQEHGLREIRTDAWYPQQPWLDAYRAIGEKIGTNTLFTIGQRIPQDAVWPPQVSTVDAALASIDVAYHMNHRLDGQLMFNAETREMIEGIGHYSVQEMSPRRVEMHCHTPYPSDFDRGIIMGVVRHFKPSAEVELDETKPTRKRGADTCTFIVTW